MSGWEPLSLRHQYQLPGPDQAGQHRDGMSWTWVQNISTRGFQHGQHITAASTISTCCKKGAPWLPPRATLPLSAPKSKFRGRRNFLGQVTTLVLLGLRFPGT